MKAVLTCLEPGQFIPIHRPGVEMLLIVLEGEGELIAGEQRGAARPGTVVFVPREKRAESMSHRLKGGGFGNGLKALFRPKAGRMFPAPGGLQEVDGLNRLL